MPASPSDEDSMEVKTLGSLVVVAWDRGRTGFWFSELQNLERSRDDRHSHYTERAIPAWETCVTDEENFRWIPNGCYAQSLAFLKAADYFHYSGRPDCRARFVRLLNTWSKFKTFWLTEKVSNSTWVRIAFATLYYHQRFILHRWVSRLFLYSKQRGTVVPTPKHHSTNACTG